MLRLSSIVRIIIVAVTALPSYACAAGADGSGGAPTQLPTPNDPALEAAAASVRPVLEQSYADSFAGIELRHEVPMMIVYRRPHPSLDAEVTKSWPNVRIAFRDARYSLAEIKLYVDRLLADSGYWKDRGMPIVAVAPAVDGSGIQVATSGNRHDLARALPARYGNMSFVVRMSSQVIPPVYTGPPPILGPS